MKYMSNNEKWTSYLDQFNYFYCGTFMQPKDACVDLWYPNFCIPPLAKFKPNLIQRLIRAWQFSIKAKCSDQISHIRVLVFYQSISHLQIYWPIYRQSQNGQICCKFLKKQYY